MREEVGMYTEKSRKMGKKLKFLLLGSETQGGGVEKRNFTFHLIPFSTV